MERRKFLAAVGSLTAGTAAAMSTGAFTSVQAERSVTVNIAGDSDAFLGLEATTDPNSDYVHTNNGQVEIVLDESEVGGSGFNKNAVTEIDKMLKVTNQGTQRIYFWIEHPNSTPFTVDNFWFYTDDSPNTKLHNGDAGDGDDYQVLTLSPGESAKLGVKGDFGDVSTDASFNGEVTFYANSTKPGGSGPVESGGDEALVVTPNPDPDNDNEFRYIQDAVDAAGGTTILVEEGTYEESVSINVEDLTLKGPKADAPPDNRSGKEATIEGKIEIDASGVTVNGFEISLPTKFVPDQNRKAGIFVSASNTKVKNNIVTSINGDSGDTYSSIHGIQVFEQNPDRISNIDITDNLIENVHHDSSGDGYGGAVGVKVQNQLDSVTVSGNTIRKITSAGWTYGIVTSPSSKNSAQPTSVLIKENSIEAIGNETVNPDAEYEGVAVGVDTASGNPETDPEANADEVTVTSNDFIETPVGAINKDRSSELSATNNWWGDDSGPSGEGQGSGAAVGENVDFDPWSDSPNTS